MSEFMELNEGKKGISSPAVPLIRVDTVTGQIRDEMGFSGNGVIASPLAYMFLVVNTRIICSGHKSPRIADSLSKEIKHTYSKERKHVRSKNSLFKAHLLGKCACLLMTFREWRRIFVPQGPKCNKRN